MIVGSLYIFRMRLVTNTCFKDTQDTHRFNNLIHSWTIPNSDFAQSFISLAAIAGRGASTRDAPEMVKAGGNYGLHSIMHDTGDDRLECNNNKLLIDPPNWKFNAPPLGGGSPSNDRLNPDHYFARRIRLDTCNAKPIVCSLMFIFKDHESLMNKVKANSNHGL